MKKLIILFITILSVAVYGQDEATKNKAKVLYFSAEELYNNGNYTQTISKIKEIENLLGGKKIGTVQNLKVKSYIGLKDYENVVDELDILQTLPLGDEILKEVALYTAKIDGEMQKVKDFRAVVKKAENGNVEAMMELASKENSNKNYSKAAYWYEKSAQKGDSYAMYSLGDLYEYGNLGTKDIEKAIQWYEKSAQKKYPQAMEKLGYIYYNGEDKVLAEDYEKATYWWELAYNSEVPDAGLSQTYLPNLIYSYDIYLKNLEKAKYWESILEKRDCSYDGYHLAEKYQKSNPQKAIYWFEVSGENNNGYAMALLLTYYHNVKSYKKEQYWKNKMIQKNKINEAYSLSGTAKNYYNKGNYQKAMEFYQLACELKVPNACSNYEVCVRKLSK